MKKMKLLLFAVSLIALMTIGERFVFAATYTIDPVHSNIGFSIKHLVITNVKGRFADFNGELVFDEEKKELKKAAIQIKTISIDTGIVKRDEHLRSSDFFDAAKYPTISFELKKTTIKDGKTIFIGDLTMHGVTKEIQLTGEYLGAVKDPWGGQRIAFSAEGMLNRMDYGVKWNQTLETGGLLVGDSVKLLIEVECVLKK
ncbi:MAG: polyisoprenoid-binding protein [Nitrospirae bacterium]|nr:polyisoprenoid-binding protein [Nitrospirota bacterium]